MRCPRLGGILAVLVVLGGACDRDPTPAEPDAVDGAQTSAEDRLSQARISEAVVDLDGPETPFERSELESMAREWQGNWLVTRHDEDHNPQAWSVNGAHVSIFWSDGGDSGTETGRFRIFSPCGAKVDDVESETTHLGRSKVTGETRRRVLYAFGDEARYASAGLSSEDVDAAGVVTDEGFTLCIGASRIVKWKKFSGCKWWLYDSGYGSPKSIECSLSEQSAEVETPDGRYLTVERTGDVLLGEDMLESKVREFPSFEAAKSVID